MEIYTVAISIIPSVSENTVHDPGDDKHGKEEMNVTHKAGDCQDSDEDYDPQNDEAAAEEEELSDLPDSDLDDEHMIAKEKLKDFRSRSVDNGNGLSMKIFSLRPIDVDSYQALSNMQEDNDNDNDDSGYNAEYADSEAEVDTPKSSDEDDLQARKRVKKRKIVYNPRCNHNVFNFQLGMKFTDAEQFRGAV